MKLVKFLVTWLICVIPVGTTAADSVLMFSADWCGYCQVAKKDMMEHKEEVIPWMLEIVDVDTSRDMARDYKVKSMPTFVYLNSKGEEVDRLVGYTGYDKLSQWVKKNKR